MRKVPTPSGPLPFQLYFEDLGEIDEICLESLKSQSLLPSEPAPIRIERFIEKQFNTALRYEDLGPDNLGCTTNSISRQAYIEKEGVRNAPKGNLPGGSRKSYQMSYIFNQSKLQPQ
jgi:hypothetical protein